MDGRAFETNTLNDDDENENEDDSYCMYPLMSGMDYDLLLGEKQLTVDLRRPSCHCRTVSIRVSQKAIRSSAQNGELSN